MAQNVLYKKKSGPGLLDPAMRNFTLLWIGQLVSLVGSGMTCFAQSVSVYTDLGGTITHLTLLAVAAQLPGIFVSPLAGVLADRWDRRKIMIVSDAVAALGTLTLRTLVVSDSFQLWQMYVLVVIISMANHFQWPAYFAAIPMLAPKDRLGYANGLVQAGRSFSTVVAPLMAGFLVTTFRLEGVILFDLGTYVFATVLLLVTRFPKTPTTAVGRAGKGSLWQESMYGWRYLTARPGLIAMMALFAVANYLLAHVITLFLPLVLTISTASVLGSMMALGGVAGLTGSLIMGAWGGPKRRIYGILAFMAMQGVALSLIGLRPSVLLMCVAYLMFMFAGPFVNACSGVIWQSKVPFDMQGRVLAASNMVLTASLEFGYFTSLSADLLFEPALAPGGSLASSVGQIIGVGEGRGVGLMFIIMGVISLTATLVGALYPRLRLLDTELPDVIDDSDFARPATTEASRPAWRQIDITAD